MRRGQLGRLEVHPRRLPFDQLVHTGQQLGGGPRGRAAAELLPGVDELIEWQAPWVDFEAPELTAPTQGTAAIRHSSASGSGDW
ncbi:hypothetical protein MAHJHV60_47540 [Mycobacterium avium subsp. hominissuis]